MKKLIPLFLLLSATTFYASAQWIGTNPVTTNSQVGISTTTPDGQQEIVQYGVPIANSSSVIGLGFIQKDLTLTRIMGVNPTTGGTMPIGGSSTGTEPVFLSRTILNPSTPSNYLTNFIIDVNGKTGVGIANPLAQLHVLNTFLMSDNTGNNIFKVNNTGEVWARKVTVTLAVIPDYVFAKNYNLMPLTDVEKYINENKHLPNIKSAEEYQKEPGVDIGEMQAKLLEKVEELTLYIIQQQKQIDELTLKLAK